MSNEYSISLRIKRSVLKGLDTVEKIKKNLLTNITSENVRQTIRTSSSQFDSHGSNTCKKNSKSYEQLLCNFYVYWVRSYQRATNGHYSDSFLAHFLMWCYFTYPRWHYAFAHTTHYNYEEITKNTWKVLISNKIRHRIVNI